MIYLSLGSNIGHRLSYLQQAVVLLQQRYLRKTRCSIVIETDCLLPPDAPLDWKRPFLNMIVQGECDLTPLALLRGLKAIEQELGRPPEYAKWAPRIIDIDILHWQDLTLDTPALTIPHPELKNRPFLQHLLALLNPTFCFSTAEKWKSLAVTPKLVGVVNLTPDSFSDGGCYTAVDAAITRIEQLMTEGATVIELGAQSTRPGAIIQPPEVEYQRLKLVLDECLAIMQQRKITLSIDTFQPTVIRDLLTNYSIQWINDVSGHLDADILKLIAQQNCKLVTMHALGIPPRQTLPDPLDPLIAIKSWATQTLEKLVNLGFDATNIILDPGIGFGKTVYQNIHLLRHIEVLKSFNVAVLIGHSRKSFMHAFSEVAISERDLETIAISGILAHKVDYLRVHNVQDHQRFFTAQACFI